MQINRFYAARVQRAEISRRLPRAKCAVESVTVGNAALYWTDYFDVPPTLSNIGAVVNNLPCQRVEKAWKDRRHASV